MIRFTLIVLFVFVAVGCGNQQESAPVTESTGDTGDHSDGLTHDHDEGDAHSHADGTTHDHDGGGDGQGGGGGTLASVWHHWFPECQRRGSYSGRCCFSRVRRRGHA